MATIAKFMRRGSMAILVAACCAPLWAETVALFRRALAG